MSVQGAMTYSRRNARKPGTLSGQDGSRCQLLASCAVSLSPRTRSSFPVSRTSLQGCACDFVTAHILSKRIPHTGSVGLIPGVRQRVGTDLTTALGKGPLETMGKSFTPVDYGAEYIKENSFYHGIHSILI